MKGAIVTENISLLALDLRSTVCLCLKITTGRLPTDVKEHSAYRDVSELSICTVFCLLHITHISNVQFTHLKALEAPEAGCALRCVLPSAQLWLLVVVLPDFSIVWLHGEGII